MARRIRKGGRDGQAPQHFTFPTRGRDTAGASSRLPDGLIMRRRRAGKILREDPRRWNICYMQNLFYTFEILI